MMLLLTALVHVKSCKNGKAKCPTNEMISTLLLNLIFLLPLVIVILYDRVALELRHIAQEKSAEMLIPDLLYLQSYNT